MIHAELGLTYYRSQHEFFRKQNFMEGREVYESIINKTIEQMSKSPEAQGVRKEVFDAVKRRWTVSLEKELNIADASHKLHTSDPSAVVNRAIYMTHPALAKKVPPVAVDSTPAPPVSTTLPDDDEYSDEFGDAEVVHTTEVGRRLAAASSTIVPTAAARSPDPPRKPVASRRPAPVDPIDLTPDLGDPEYDNIPEPKDCECRVFGQTEICESVVGPRRGDSRWMLTILNGFIQTSEEELFFRTAKATFPHLLQQSSGLE